MLDPDDRSLLSEHLLPPHGFAFTDAIICTYSLDLIALGGVPLALLQSDPLALEGAAGARLEALRAVREMASRLTVFCQAGAIHVPAEWRDAFLWLEGSVVQVCPVAARAVFHPKLWLLRFANEAGDVRYRLLILSRNLTYDRSWDVIARLEGTFVSRKNDMRASKPLVQFVEALGTDDAIPVVGDMSQAHRDRRDRFALELRTVKFIRPDDKSGEFAFWPLGIPGHQYSLAHLFDGGRSPFQVWAKRVQLPGRRLLVVSPFLSESMVNALATSGFPVTLVSREDVLDERAGCLPEQWVSDDAKQVFSFRQEMALDGIALSGLHAKFWVADDGWVTHVWVGSVNATEAAFTRNVEFMLQIVGPRSRIGVDVLLGDQGLKQLTTPYVRQQEVPDPAQQTLRRQRDALNWLLNGLVTGQQLRVRIDPSADGKWQLSLAMSASLPLTVEDLAVQWRARPISVPWSRVATAADDGSICRCDDLSLHELTEFWTLALTVPGTELCAEATVRLKADGEWPTFQARESAALSRHLRDADSLALYLEFVLAGDDEGLRERLRRQRQHGHGDGTHNAAPVRPLFETLMQALAARPEALDEVVELIESSGQSDLMQDAGFKTLWDAFREAHADLLSE